MIIKYGNRKILAERERIAEDIFSKLPYRYCFITGSFLSKERFKDIEKEEDQEKLALVGRMTASLAHELKNPLGIIKNTAQVIQKKLFR